MHKRRSRYHVGKNEIAHPGMIVRGRSRVPDKLYTHNIELKPVAPRDATSDDVESPTNNQQAANVAPDESPGVTKNNARKKLKHRKIVGKYYTSHPL